MNEPTMDFDTNLSLIGLTDEQVSRIRQDIENVLRSIGNEDDLEQVLTAFAEMADKGVVQSGPLRMQIGEVIPGAYSAAANVMGAEPSQLRHMLENGLIHAKGFLPLFSAEIAKMYRKKPGIRGILEEFEIMQGLDADNATTADEAPNSEATESAVIIRAWMPSTEYRIPGEMIFYSGYVFSVKWPGVSGCDLPEIFAGNGEVLTGDIIHGDMIVSYERPVVKGDIIRRDDTQLKAIEVSSPPSLAFIEFEVTNLKTPDYPSYIKWHLSRGVSNVAEQTAESKLSDIGNIGEIHDPYNNGHDYARASHADDICGLIQRIEATKAELAASEPSEFNDAAIACCDSFIRQLQALLDDVGDSEPDAKTKALWDAQAALKP